MELRGTRRRDAPGRKVRSTEAQGLRTMVPSRRSVGWCGRNIPGGNLGAGGRE